MIYSKIKKERMSARIEKDLVKSNLLTTLLSDIEVVAKNDGQRVVTDQDCIAKIKVFIKGNVEFGTKLLDLGREVSDVLKTEKVILESFLPQQMSEFDIACEIEIFLEGLNEPRSMKLMGKAMSHLKSNFNGLYDGKLASKLVRDAL